MFRRKEDISPLSQLEQRLAYKTVQSGGDVPLHGFRKPAPERPKGKFLNFEFHFWLYFSWFSYTFIFAIFYSIFFNTFFLSTLFAATQVGMRLHNQSIAPDLLSRVQLLTVVATYKVCAWSLSCCWTCFYLGASSEVTFCASKHDVLNYSLHFSSNYTLECI